MKNLLISGSVFIAVFATIGQSGSNGAGVPQTSDWRVHQAYIMQEASDGRLPQAVDKYYSAWKKNAKDDAVAYGLWSSWRMFFIRSTAVNGRPRFDGLEIHDVLKGLYKRQPNKSHVLLAYAQYICLNGEPGLPKPKGTSEWKAVRQPDGKMLTVEVVHSEYDWALAKRVAQLAEKAASLEPKNPYVLLYRANRCKDTRKRYGLYKRAWTEGGRDLFAVECLKRMQEAAAVLKSTELQAEVKKMQDNSEQWKSPSLQRYFGGWASVDLSYGKLKLWELTKQK